MTNRPVLSPEGFFRRTPLAPQQMTEALTPVADTIVLCHLGVPQLEAMSWRLEIEGLVAHPQRLNLEDLRRWHLVRVEAVHQCAGSPLQPEVPTRRVSNVVWGGVRLADILKACAPTSSARYLWSEGADHGVFAGQACDHYVKDLPLGRGLMADTLLAFEMNGAPLPPEHGFPVRLVVPGYFGTNSVKWLQRITVADRRAEGPFVTRWYNDPMLDAEGRATGAIRPVWQLHPEAIIVAPAPTATLQLGKPAEIWGWAWSDDDVVDVAVSTDGGASFRSAALKPRRQRSWQRYRLDWTPERPGPVEIRVRATDATGATQPEAGWRNAVHAITVTIA